MTKKCPNCKIEKDYSEFRIDRSKNPPLKILIVKYVTL